MENYTVSRHRLTSLIERLSEHLGDGAGETGSVIDEAFVTVVADAYLDDPAIANSAFNSYAGGLTRALRHKGKARPVLDDLLGQLASALRTLDRYPTLEVDDVVSHLRAGARASYAPIE